MVKRSISSFFTERQRKRTIRKSAELARLQVKAVAAKRRLAEIEQLMVAERQIKQLKKAEFDRSRVGKTLKLGRRFLLPPSKGAVKFAGRAGKKVLSESVRSTGRKRKPKKRQEQRGKDFIGGFNPNFRFV